MSNKNISGYRVGIILSIIAIIASILVIIINIYKNESTGVGIGLLIFSFLSLRTNIKNKNSTRS